MNKGVLELEVGTPGLSEPVDAEAAFSDLDHTLDIPHTC
jgi:hypothetical protein